MGCELLFRRHPAVSAGFSTGEFRAPRFHLARGYGRGEGAARHADQPNVAFRPTHEDGIWNAVFMRFIVAKIDINQEKSRSQTVRYVSEHLSGMSPL